ncbi:DNA-binding transcriptional LysR family regulator [Actinoalloteichus hoggarensis]|uniref:HTH-type transcriptional regulator CatM n=1 Tax=Actinoalloteichus hoggarensis TaxID=1470176 RepID=A0A221W190_9PSEU|nr:LysR family transcriptional regulator [Actinoalloteichus hoggarensis]ASO19565.1 HTH-type transcriptional regulator CatM [Actinoalloteichus hoggarensis]MBB5919728.1 DNA-binding transcriptional LysR family regulator [Actinoalloteichus hoggarensis]
MRYDLDDLRLFVHVVTEGSITAGARRMLLSLPSASARVRSLERHAGVELLIRERRGVRPTPAGVTLLRHARDVLAQTALLEGAVAGYARTSSAPLVLLAGGSAMHRFVPQALVSFLRAHPDVDVTVEECPTPRTVRRLAEGEADLGIIQDDEAADRDLRTEPLGDDSLVVIGRVGGVLAGRGALRYREAAEHPLIGPGRDSSLQRWIDKHVGPHAPAPRYRTHVADLTTVITLAMAGVGLAVVPSRAVAEHTPVETCALQDGWARRRQLLCWGAGTREPSAAVTALARHLRAAAGAEEPTRLDAPPRPEEP